MVNIIKNKKMKLNEYIIPFILSFVIMLLFSESSPLYKLNEFADSQIYFTIGRGMMEGLIPYKDLVDQKGPLTFLIYGIASLFKLPGNMYFGVYIFESLSLFISIVLCKKILDLFISSKTAFILSFFWPVLLVVRIAFITGGSAEEYALPFILGLIYFTLKLMFNNYKASKISILIQGILFGCVFWMKYTLVGAWIGLALALSIILIYKKRGKEVLKYIIYGLLGFLIATLPWLIYFGLNHALKSLFIGYFYYNIFVYPRPVSIIKKILFDGFYTVFSFFKNPIMMLIINWGAYVAIISGKLLKKWDNRILLIVMMLCNAGLVYSGFVFGKNYQLVIVPFGILTIAYIGKYIESKKIKLDKIPKVVICVIVIILCGLVNNNLKYSKLAGNTQTVQYQFVDKMRKISGKQNPSFFEYNTLDYGFYSVANQLPSTKYFNRMVNSEAFPEIKKSQDKIINKKKVEFVIIKVGEDEKIKTAYKNVLKNYKIIESQKYYDEYLPGYDGTFYLLERK